MFRAVQERNPRIPGYSERLYDEEEEGRWREGAMVQTSGRSGAWPEGADGSGTESKIESAAAACVLWSTIGVGCLVGGHPKSSVSQPRCCFSSGSWVWLGVLNGISVIFCAVNIGQWTNVGTLPTFETKVQLSNHSKTFLTHAIE